MTLRRFLYISPYFPPQSRVGALRPLKFARHLPSHGWAPVVLADLRPDDGRAPALADAIPEAAIVIRDYGPRAHHPPTPPKASHRSGLTDRLNPEWLPLGRHSVDMPHALRAARRALAAHDCEAIVVNADPYAAMLVGDRLGRETGLPVIHDLRDPWSVCALRRPRRPALQRWLVDRLERRCIEGAARVVLNSETALADYRAHYRDLDPARFTCIRNHGDPALIAGGAFAPGPVFTALVLGGFRRFVEGDVLFEALASLRADGIGPDRLRLTVSGAVPPDAWRRAAALGVDDMLHDHPFVPYHHIGPFMASADLLVALGNDTRQRIPAKIYDYALTERPMLVIADNPEIDAMLAPLGGVERCRLGDAAGVADAMRRALAAGRQRCIRRRGNGFDSASAAARMAAVLDAAAG